MNIFPNEVSVVGLPRSFIYLSGQHSKNLQVESLFAASPPDKKKQVTLITVLKYPEKNATKKVFLFF